jgi:hypothetical protein
MNMNNYLNLKRAFMDCIADSIVDSEYETARQLIHAMECVRFPSDLDIDVIDGLNTQERALALTSKIECIKALRTRTNCLLKEAVDIVNAYQDKHKAL